MKFCTHCGAQLADNDMFCTACGSAQPGDPDPNQTKNNTVPDNNGGNNYGGFTGNQTSNGNGGNNYGGFTGNQQNSGNGGYNNSGYNTTGGGYNGNNAGAKADNSALAMVAKVFMVISCIAMGWALIPLAWLLPITITTFGRLNRGEPVGIGLKVATLLFVNTIAGICLLCGGDNL